MDIQLASENGGGQRGKRRGHEEGRNGGNTIKKTKICFKGYWTTIGE